MSSYFMKTLIGNEFDKVIKEFAGSDKEEEENEPESISREELVAEQNRQAAIEKDRQIRQAKIEAEREEARQKIRDKYNIKKKGDPPTTTKTQQEGKVNNLTTRMDNMNATSEKVNEPEPQGFQPVKATVDAFNSFKRKFGWK